MTDKCENCTDKCPQADRAHQAALGRMYATNELLSYLKKIESGELVEVVHGEWIVRYWGEWLRPTCECSVCHEWENSMKNYCPYCGAKMDLK